MARTITYRTFRGINNILPEDSLVSREGVFLRTVTNADIDNAGRVRRRKGFDSVVSADVHSLWSDNDLCFFRQTTYLKQMLADYTTRTVASGLPDNDLPMAFLSLNGLVYYTDSQVTGVIVDSGRANRSWGLALPPTPDVAEAAGVLPAGRYLITATYLRNDGQESGSDVPALITLGAAGGIAVALTPSDDPTVSTIRLYASFPDGQGLYLAGEYANLSTTVVYDGESGLGRELKTFLLAPAPAGHLIEYFNGRVYVASNSYVFPSRPYAYELFDMDDYLPFDGIITLLAAVDDGLYVSDGKKTYFLAEGKKRTEVCPYGAIEGTAAKVDLATIGDGTKEGTAIMWASGKGIILGSNGGQITNLTEGKYVFPSAPSGAALFRQQNGINQYILVLDTDGTRTDEAYEWRKITGHCEIELDLAATA
jgi:hypothetical protein